MIRTLITDFGGVLLRTHDDTPRRQLEALLGLPPHTIEGRVFGGELSIRAQYGLISHAEFWRQIGVELGLNDRMTAEQLRDEFFSGDAFDEELMAFYRSVRPAIKTGMITNAWSNARELFTITFPIAQDFDAIVISAEESVMKPDPRIYRIALDRLGVRAAEAIFVDDVPANVQGAEAIGMVGVHFRSTDQVRREIDRLLSNAGSPNSDGN